MTGLQVHRDAGDQPAAPDRHNDSVEALQLRQHLERDGALAGDHVGVVVGMNEGGAGPLLLFRRGHERFVIALAGGHDARAEALDRIDLQLVGGQRHVHGCRDLELRGRIGHAHAVVARGGGDDAGGSALGRHAHELVQRAADLEGANGLDRL